MRLESIEIRDYRSIKSVNMTLPVKKPLVLFGPNNAGKSNIVSAIHMALGERWPLNNDLADSDFYMRDKGKHSEIAVRCEFNSNILLSRFKNKNTNRWQDRLLPYFNLKLCSEPSMNRFEDDDGIKITPSRGDLSQVSSFLIDATRDISRQFSYYSKNSLLSRFAHAIHDSMAPEDKESLTKAFESIQSTFKGLGVYQAFFESFQETVEESVKGFTHKLEADLSAYDPNSFAKSLQIVATESGSIRSFEEFGTGEQQILLMAFAKAYVETFSRGSLVLIIEEPEAHLHPLAQRWLKEYVYELCDNDRFQVVMTTHSPDFIDFDNLEGLVRVSKDAEGRTIATQLTGEELSNVCLGMDADPRKSQPGYVGEFYSTHILSDGAKGFFAEHVLLVEGPTEYYTLPTLFRKMGLSMAREGLEIVLVGGKNSIPSFYRLFKAYGYHCTCLFDADQGKKDSEKDNSELSHLFGTDIRSQMVSSDRFVRDNEYAFFVKDYEQFMRSAVPDYSERENEFKQEHGKGNKQGVAKALAMGMSAEEIPEAFEQVWNMATSLNGEVNETTS